MLGVGAGAGAFAGGAFLDALFLDGVGAGDDEDFLFIAEAGSVFDASDSSPDFVPDPLPPPKLNKPPNGDDGELLSDGFASKDGCPFPPGADDVFAEAADFTGAGLGMAFLGAGFLGAGFGAVF